MKEEGLSKEKHKARHKLLHECFDELLADFIKDTRKLISETTLFELMEWSNKQTKKAK